MISQKNTGKPDDCTFYTQITMKETVAFKVVYNPFFCRIDDNFYMSKEDVAFVEAMRGETTQEVEN